MTSWSRRDALRSMTLGTAALSLPAWARAAAGDSLDALARAKGLRFGTSMSTGVQRPGALEDPRYVELIKRECGIIVPENELKMYVIQPSPEVYNFERADRLVKFATDNNLALRGHTLLWHHPRWLPRWLATYDFGANPRAAAEQMLTDQITKTASRFGTRIGSWDVVNEAVHNVTGEMRETPLSKAFGNADDVLFHAFRTARALLPDTELVYNDYMGWEKTNAPHRDGVLRLLERFRKHKIPVDALGIQAHIGAGNQDSNANLAFDTRDEKSWRRFLKEVTDMDYQLLITEFDVHDTPLPADFAERDALVADLGRAFLDVTLDFHELHTVMCWGLVDSRSWLQGRTPRADKLPKRPNPFDADYQPKKLREAIATAFRAAPGRRRQKK